MLGWTTCVVVARQFVSFAGLRKSLEMFRVAGVSSVLCGMADDTWIAPSGLQALSIAWRKCTIASILTNVSIANSGGSSSGAVVSDPLVVRLESTSSAESAMPARGTTSILNSGCRSRQRVRRTELANKFKIRLSES